MKLGVWIMSLLQPALGRILASLGFSVVSIVGMEAIFQQLKSQLTTNLAGLPLDALQLFLLGGGGTGIGIILGALTTKFLLWQVQKSTQILGRNPG